MAEEDRSKEHGEEEITRKRPSVDSVMSSSRVFCFAQQRVYVVQMWYSLCTVCLVPIAAQWFGSIPIKSPGRRDGIPLKPLRRNGFSELYWPIYY